MINSRMVPELKQEPGECLLLLHRPYLRPAHGLEVQVANGGVQVQGNEVPPIPLAGAQVQMLHRGPVVPPPAGRVPANSPMDGMYNMRKY